MRHYLKYVSYCSTPKSPYGGHFSLQGIRNIIASLERTREIKVFLQPMQLHGSLQTHIIHVQHYRTVVLSHYKGLARELKIYLQPMQLHGSL